MECGEGRLDCNLLMHIGILMHISPVHAPTPCIVKLYKTSMDWGQAAMSWSEIRLAACYLYRTRPEMCRCSRRPRQRNPDVHAGGRSQKQCSIQRSRQQTACLKAGSPADGNPALMIMPGFMCSSSHPLQSTDLTLLFWSHQLCTSKAGDVELGASRIMQALTSIQFPAGPAPYLVGAVM